MKVCRFVPPVSGSTSHPTPAPRLGVLTPDGSEVLDLTSLGVERLSVLLNHPDCRLALEAYLRSPAARRAPLSSVTLLAPVDTQEVWAAGVTYLRSKSARMEESDFSATAYDRVYDAARPEIFFKSMPAKVSGPGGPIGIRSDARWNVPEPELVLVLNARGAVVGYTIGNDMSSRDIEGENPLYLPQAKVYRQCCGLGPWITLAPAMPPRDQIGISLKIDRQGASVFEGTTQISAMARTFEDLISWLGRENDFPDGAILLTGTGIVPDPPFTLQSGDQVAITIDGIGTLTNPIVQDPAQSA